MLHIVHGAQIGIRLCTAKTGICLKLPDKQQHSASLCPVAEASAVVLWLCQWNRLSLME